MISALYFFENDDELPKPDNNLLKDEINASNTVRALIIMIIAIIISTTIILLYSHQIQNNSATELLWKQRVIILNKCILVIFIIQAAAGLVKFKSKKIQTALSSTLVTSTLIILPLWGAAGSVLDQMVTSSIISFLIVCMGIALGLLVKPIISFLNFSIAYIIFIWGINNTQKNPELLLINEIDGFCIVVASFGLSYFFWRNNLIKLRQRKIILNQKKELELNYKKLLESSQELQKALITKDKFFSILGHDLRGPITSSHSLTQLITAGIFDDNQAEKEKAIHMVDKSLEHVIKLLNDLLLWSLTQTNNLSFNPVSLNLKNVVKTNIQLMELSAQKKEINIICHLENSIIVKADKNMLDTMLRNLISNSIKFSHNGSRIDIYAGVTNYLNKKTDNITISVVDQGVGISPNMQEHLFDLAYKTSTPGTQKESGTGLGLILCKELAEHHNGSISFESKTGEGSKFMIHLPLQVENNPSVKTKIMETIEG